MPFLDKIVSSVGDFDYGKSLINELRKTSYPNYIYGAGYLGFQILTLLSKVHIPIAGIVVDDNYWNNAQTVEKLTVLPLNEICNSEKCINLIMAFDESLNVIRKKLSNNKHINKIYQLDPDSINTNHLTYSYVIDNISKFEAVYDMCEDELSRNVFCNFINTKITGNTSYLNNICTRDIYFPKDIITLKDDEIFVDCGAFDGDTIISFLKNANDVYDKIYAFEPNPANISILNDTIQKNEIKNVTVLPYGVWSEKNVLKFISSNEKSQTGSFVSAISYHDAPTLNVTELAVESIDSAIDIREKGFLYQNGY